MPKTKSSKSNSKSGRNSTGKSVKTGKSKTKSSGGCGCSVGGGDDSTDYTIILLCLLFFLVVIYYYIYMENQRAEQKVVPKADPKRERDTKIEGFSDRDFNGKKVPVGANIVTIVKFYAPWCGHCKSLAPTWADVESQYNNKKVNGKTIKVLQVNCDENTKLAEKHDVKGYPTIKTFHNGKEEDYSGGRDLASISDHIEELASS